MNKYLININNKLIVSVVYMNPSFSYCKSEMWLEMTIQLEIEMWRQFAVIQCLMYKRLNPITKL